MPLTRRLSRALCTLVLMGGAAVQAQTFTSSNLPIVVLNTNGVAIPDDPKIPALMGIIDNGPGVRNNVGDAPNDFSGHIGIEIRGSSSQMFPKKQYGFETRDSTGADLDVSLLGFPEESDWILYAPYTDKSMMRDVMTYDLARSMGHYASRTRYCELVLNGQYQGVYVLLEKVKRDANRVAINRLKPDETTGDDLTGGYLLQVDRLFGSTTAGWMSPFPSGSTGGHTSYVYEDPDPEDIVPQQTAYIRSFINTFETTMRSSTYEDPQTGYPSMIDMDSFVDFFLLTELGKNVDGYRLSSYLYKDKDSIDPLLHAGPIWDINIAFGNADYYNGSAVIGLQALAPGDYDNPVPFWWARLASSSRFRTAAAARWHELRQGPFHTDSLMQRIDGNAALLSEAQVRNYQRWRILGTYVWPNAYVGQTYADEVGYLKTWLRQRIAWLDTAFPAPTATEPTALGTFALTAGPNPFRHQTQISLTLGQPQNAVVEVFDALGRRVSVLHSGPLSAEPHAFTLDGDGLPAGVYLVRARGESVSADLRVVSTGR